MFKKGQKVNAKVTSIVNYGAFCEITEGTDVFKGLIHISEISDFYVSDIREFFEIGDSIDVEVLEVIEDKKQAKLSYKNLNPELLKGSESKLQETGTGFDGLEESITETK